MSALSSRAQRMISFGIIARRHMPPRFAVGRGLTGTPNAHKFASGNPFAPAAWCSPHPPHPANPQRSQVRAGEPRAWSPVRFAIIDCFTALAENSTPWSFLNASRPNRGRFAAPPQLTELREGLRGFGGYEGWGHAIISSATKKY